MSETTVKFETPDGDGQATRASSLDAWTVDAPTTSFRWYGTKPGVKLEIRRRLQLAYPGQKIVFS